MGQFSGRETKGYFTEIGPGGIVSEGETLQCCHCQKHWVKQPGSGKVRGFCRHHMQVTCGRPECDPCPEDKGNRVSVPANYRPNKSGIFIAE